jgi:hypothetical protein
LTSSDFVLAASDAGVPSGNVYRCPGGEEVCIGRTNECREGHRGVGCAFCVRGYAMSMRSCKPCPPSTASITVVCIVVGIAAAVVAYYAAVLRPLFLLYERRFWQRLAQAWVFTRVVEPLAHSFHAIAGSGADSQISLRDALKVIVGFFQGMVSILRVTVPWPNCLTLLAGWLEIFDFALLELPSVGCVFVDFSFFDKLLLAAVSPLVLLVLFLLPSLATMRLPTGPQMLDRFCQSAIFALLILYVNCVGLVYR